MSVCSYGRGEQPDRDRISEPDASAMLPRYQDGPHGPGLTLKYVLLLTPFTAVHCFVSAGTAVCFSKLGMRRLPSTLGLTMPQWEYHGLLPTGNKHLQKQWDKASYDIHRRKVISTEATINTTAPTETYGHLALKSKSKKQQVLKIERENNMLLEKIAHINRTSGLIVNTDSHERKRERRKQEMLRVTKENQVLLVRLGQCRPFYSAKAWHEEWLKTLEVMESITQYPPRHKREVQVRDLALMMCSYEC
ncbi:hypothetical protein N1851_008282 [Merluccius polli]|uniref:Uncharacterized protein n=1 Tax=Merluccius polli TaxID=89951 RepID=A0AA47N1E0_MERPO|nr:hypothetical protein N1851_008282 [Merluccius polli]